MNYKENYVFVGESDIANLTFVGMKEEAPYIKAEAIDMGGDGSYKAYIINSNSEIPKHYNKVAEFKNWLKIYDDNGLTFDKRVKAGVIEVYRAGDYGLLIAGDFEE